MFFSSALLLGFLGSIHCLGMCGPIVLTLKWGESNKFRGAIKRVFYFVSKSIAYACLGFVAGLIGDTFRFFGFQQLISIVIGTIMVVASSASLLKIKIPSNFSFLSKVFHFAKSSLSGVIKADKPGAFLIIGFLNGLLPCGFVYVGLGASLTANSSMESGIYMFLFGLGTIPALLLLSFVPSLALGKFGWKIRKLIPLISLTMGIILLLRGLNLGIPYLSPKMQTNKTEQIKNAKIDCCK